MNHPVISWKAKVIRSVAAVGIGTALAGPAAAQNIEYTVTDIPQVSDAFSTAPLSINDDGVIVGWAQYSGGEFYLRGWRWSEEDGLTLLPPPPGAMSRRYSAVDINELGVIAGDGGYDSGQVWRFENDTYTLIDLLPGLDATRGSAINNGGVLVATAFDSQHFTTPTRALLHSDRTGTIDLFPDLVKSGAADINDARQIAASSPAIGAFRVEPDGSRTMLFVPPGFVGFSPSRINEAGDIAGIAACSHECDQAALWTANGGYQIIPAAGTRHSVGGVNIRQEVVGSVTEGVSYAWIWSPQRGLRLLASLIDRALTRNVVFAMDVNNVGQILAIGYDYSTNQWCDMVLTPVYWLTVDNLVSGQDAILTLTGATPDANQYLVYSLRGQGSTYLRELNVTLDLAQPVLLTSGRADTNGTFETTVPVPPPPPAAPCGSRQRR